MKLPAISLPVLVALSVSAPADPASKRSGDPQTPAPTVKNPTYKEESPLPKGWPEPGPFNQVVRKSYPAYRAAYTTESSPNGGFWKLFKHIKNNDIPMTAPVEMNLDPSDTKASKMTEMAFLYQSPEVGKTGPDGDAVAVRDLPAREALSYAWLGDRNPTTTASARAAIDAELARLNLKADAYRLLGYNSPFVPRSKQTHELQALLETGPPRKD